MSSAP
jgi:hypothetical protein